MLFSKIKDLDFFASQVPSFNVAGDQSTKTWAGSLSSILVLSLTCIFGLLKLEHMAARKNPLLNTNIDKIDEGINYQMNQEKFMMAFSVNTIKSGYFSDPKYLRWYANFITQKDGVYSESIHPLYKCSEADM